MNDIGLKPLKLFPIIRLRNIEEIREALFRLNGGALTCLVVPRTLTSK